MSTESLSAWFVDGLTSLGHPDPASVKYAFQYSGQSSPDDTSTSDTADTQLHKLTLWLEDRVIRQWDLETRDGLRQDFWSTIDSYLKDLECPKIYLARDDQHWREVPYLRSRVVYWLVSCAISEAYAEIQEGQVVNENQNQEPTASIPIPEKVDDFPLGFSTGDMQVDRILTVLRMQFLEELEQEQKEHTELLATQIHEAAQRQTPIKEARKRKPQNRRKRG